MSFLEALKNISAERDAMVYTLNPSTQETERSGVKGQSGIHSEFQDSQNYIGEKNVTLKPKPAAGKKQWRMRGSSSGG